MAQGFHQLLPPLPAAADLSVRLAQHLPHSSIRLSGGFTGLTHLKPSKIIHLFFYKDVLYYKHFVTSDVYQKNHVFSLSMNSLEMTEVSMLYLFYLRWMLVYQISKWEK